MPGMPWGLARFYSPGCFAHRGVALAKTVLGVQRRDLVLFEPIEQMPALRSAQALDFMNEQRDRPPDMAVLQSPSFLSFLRFHALQTLFERL